MHSLYILGPILGSLLSVITLFILSLFDEDLDGVDFRIHFLLIFSVLMILSVALCRLTGYKVFI